MKKYRWIPGTLSGEILWRGIYFIYRSHWPRLGAIHLEQIKIIVREEAQPAKPELFTLWSFIGKVC